MAGNELYSTDPRFANQFGPRTGPGGYPMGGYAGNVGGPAGFGYTPITGNAAPQGFPSGLQGAGGYAAAAGSILHGTQMAEDELRRSAEAMFRHRATGIVQGYGGYQQRLGAESAAQGLSPEAVRLQTMGGQPMIQSQIGEAQAGADAELHQLLAQLFKGTGTELAGLKLNELQTLLQSYWQRKGMKAANTANMFNLAGSALGAGANVASAGMMGGGMGYGGPGQVGVYQR